MQVDVAEMLTAGKEEAYLRPLWDMFSTGGVSEADKAEYLRYYTAPGAMRAGFQHYATLLEDGEVNRATLSRQLSMPVLVLNGDAGLPQPPLLGGARQVAHHVEADIVPDSGHALGSDNPRWVANRLNRFFTAAPAAR